MKRDTILMGAANFGPGAVTIWDGFKVWLNKKGLPFEYILYNNYERQISELLLGHIDVAWNDPTIAVGTPNSVESTMLPVLALKDAGLEPARDYKLLVCESSDLGYRPWIIDGEVAAAKAVVEGKADAAGLSEANYQAFGKDGTIPASAMRVLDPHAEIRPL